MRIGAQENVDVEGAGTYGDAELAGAGAGCAGCIPRGTWQFDCVTPSSTAAVSDAVMLMVAEPGTSRSYASWPDRPVILTIFGTR
jgi:hypothetical protein